MIKDHTHPDINSFAGVPISRLLLPHLPREEAICLQEKSLQDRSVR